IGERGNDGNRVDSNPVSIDAVWLVHEHLRGGVAAADDDGVDALPRLRERGDDPRNGGRCEESCEAGYQRLATALEQRRDDTEADGEAKCEERAPHLVLMTDAVETPVVGDEDDEGARVGECGAERPAGAEVGEGGLGTR